MRPLLVVITLLAFCLALACSNLNESAATDSPPSQAKPSGTPSVTVIEPTVNIDLPPATANKVRMGDTIADRANRRPRVDANPHATPAPLEFRPAPESSRAALAMNSDGSIREVRIFDKHPVLASVEAVSIGSEQKDVKIKLRNGRVVRLKTGRIGDLASTPLQTILSLADK